MFDIENPSTSRTPDSQLNEQLLLPILVPRPDENTSIINEDPALRLPHDVQAASSSDTTERQSFQLNPMAPPFPGLIDQQNTGARRKENVGSKKGKSTKIKPTPSQHQKANTRYMPPVNQHDFDLETKDRQLNIANAQIQKIEAEKVRLEKTNYILGERIKLLEGNRTARLEEGCEQINRRRECPEEAPNDNYNYYWGVCVKSNMCPGSAFV